MNEEERRQARLKLAKKFSDEVDTWSSEKLRNCYAQPEAVKKAEERERMNSDREIAAARRASKWNLWLREHLPRPKSERLYVVQSEPGAACGPATLRECERWIDGYIAARLERP